MDIHRMLLRASTALATLALSAACATDEQPRPTQPAAGPSDVPTLIGDAACQSDAQCSTVGVGAKACGGPAAYVAWSTWRTDGNALRAAAQRDASVQREGLAASGRASNCMVEPDPGAYCDRPPGSRENGVCRLHGRNTGIAPITR